MFEFPNSTKFAKFAAADVSPHRFPFPVLVFHFVVIRVVPQATSAGLAGAPPRYIIVGDVHGCVDELRDLLVAAGRVPEDVVVSVGDLVNKGVWAIVCVCVCGFA